ncbi:glycosyl transferase family 2 [Vibrio cholerae]|uniref:glycosyltransferase family 2 protein n=1 Tax=Vibrio cholerae TaxID=666 RepID=UPI0011DB040B|nr:glycosyltransferase family 2 protein [Vibrio cholerae]EKF9738235.1 glycosyltransferase family 2 protein [Vibrio cholerae]TXY35405.1 glycosyltransferase family 2 protein [Vibrio cholerae]BCN16699.1 rhamnosyltransferase [Vibrio cholerae]GHW86616.1 glycosyl transferase family 2 [Vibrio cholerae]
MQVFIGVVSHGHGKLIKELSCLAHLSKTFNVVIKSNVMGDSLEELISDSNQAYWIDSQYGRGFAENNNIIFKHCIESLGMTDDDIFVVLNPDVVIQVDELSVLTRRMNEHDIKISCINLYKDSNYTLYDNSIRHFPTFKQFLQSYLLGKNDSIIDKSLIKEPLEVDWAAGSFLAFQSGHYKKLGGFDDKYFMYCEDIDICYRSNKIGVPLTYYPDVKAIHLAQHKNRNIFSKHFYWHIRSVIRFLFLTYK